MCLADANIPQENDVALLRDELQAEEVLDLVPVKPLAEEVSAYVGAARPKLEGLLAKLRS